MPDYSSIAFGQACIGAKLSAVNASLATINMPDFSSIAFGHAGIGEKFSAVNAALVITNIPDFGSIAFEQASVGEKLSAINMAFAIDSLKWSIQPNSWSNLTPMSPLPIENLINRGSKNQRHSYKKNDYNSGETLNGESRNISIYSQPSSTRTNFESTICSIFNDLRLKPDHIGFEHSKKGDSPTLNVVFVFTGNINSENLNIGDITYLIQQNGKI